MTPIQSSDELRYMLAQNRAVLLIWVNWSTQAIHSRNLFAEAMAISLAAHPDQQFPCYVADVSEQRGELWDALVKWLTAENRPIGDLMMSGAGPLIWVRSGHVALHLAAPLQYDAAKVASVNNSVFFAEVERVA